jgi:hypothetical protein
MPSVTLGASSPADNPTTISVSWSSPGDMTFTLYYITQDGLSRRWTSSQGSASATFQGKPGQRYWFWATATSDLGWTDAAGSPVIQLAHKNHGQQTQVGL